MSVAASSLFLWLGTVPEEWLIGNIKTSQVLLNYRFAALHMYLCLLHDLCIWCVCFHFCAITSE
jgi:hypothetical protein